MRSYPTGNEYVALSHLSAEDGALYACNLLSSAHNGLLQFVGAPGKSRPLLAPAIFFKRKRVPLARLTWEKERDWIPVCTTTSGELALRCRWVVPPQQKGFAIIIDVAPTNDGKLDPDDLLCILAGSWAPVEHHINLSRTLTGARAIRSSIWGNGLVCEFAHGQSMAAFCVSASNKDFAVQWAGDDDLPESAAALAKLPRVAAGSNVRAGDDRALQFCLAARPLAMENGARLTFFVGFGIDEISAVSAAAHLDRVGAGKLLATTVARLEEITLQTADPVVQGAINRNAMFCYHFATGRTFDEEKFCCVTSRSTDYYASAAYWDRDALFWTFPCVLQQDRAVAAELLDYAFTTQLRNCGTHSRFIDGTVLEPGLELDQLCAPVIELVHYLRFSNDFDFARRRHIQQGVAELRQRIMKLKCANAFLFRTFLSSTDDVPPYSVVTYMNVLAWRFFFDLAYLDEKVYVAGARSNENRNCALRLRREIYTHCIRNIGGHDVFVYAVPVDGEVIHYDPLNPDRQTQEQLATGLYDDPMGSLVTLPYWGFCKYFDPVYEDTMRLFLSKSYPLSNTGERYEFCSAYHDRKISGPFVASLANQLLVRVNQQKIHDLLSEMPLDNGLACESINAKTGAAETGQGMASMAGFWAYAIYRGLAKVSSFGLPPASAEEVVRTEGAIRRAAIEAGLPYPRPHTGSTDESSATPRKSSSSRFGPGTESSRSSSSRSSGTRPTPRAPAFPGRHVRPAGRHDSIPDDIGNRLPPGAPRPMRSRYGVPDEDSDLKR